MGYLASKLPSPLLCMSMPINSHVKPTHSQIPHAKVELKEAVRLNLDTMRSSYGDVVECLSRKVVDVCSLQETRWTGG